MKKNKRILFIVLLFVALMIPSIVNAANEMTTTVNGVPYSYTLNKWDQIEDLKCTDTSKIIGAYTVPGRVDGYEVIELESYAFEDAINLTSVTLTSSIKKIGHSVFSGCENLTSVNLGSLEEISLSVFNDCVSLKSIKIPKTLTKGSGSAVFNGTTKLTSIVFENGLTKIPEGILRGCTSITNVNIPNSVTEIGHDAFSESGLTSITLPSSVKKLDYNVFAGCKNLTSVNLGSLEEISFDVFENCDNLKSIKIPKTLILGTTVGGGIFSGTTKLTSVVFENGLTKIPENILSECTGITKISIPNSVTEIGADAFSESGLTSITLPNSVKKLDYNVFAGCKNLTSVNLGSLEEISFDVFKDCENLKSIKIPKTLVKGTTFGVFKGTTKLTSVVFENGLTKIPDGILSECTSIKQITIPSSVTTIGLCAFEESGLTSVTIPSSVTKIEGMAFDGCKNLTKVVIPLSVKNIGFDVFDNTSEDLVLHVIKGSAGEKYAIKEKLNYISSRISLSNCTFSRIETKVYNELEQTQAPLIKYGNIELINGTDYTLSYSNNVKPGKATMKITGKGTYTGTVSKTFIIRPGKVSGVKTKTYGTDYVTISWKKSTGVTGYTIYKYDEKAKSYKSLGTTKGTSVKIKGLKGNKTYKFRVKAYKTIDGSKYQGAYSSTLTTGTKPSTSKISSVKSKSKKATIKWKKVTGASGYEVYMATSKKGKYSRVKSITKGSTVSYTKSSLKKKKTYYFKVRAYKTINGKKVYSSYSSVKSVKVK